MLDKQKQILIAGNGGQGISLISNVIAYAGFLENLSVKMVPQIFSKSQIDDRVYGIGFSKNPDFSFFSSQFDIIVLCSREQSKMFLTYVDLLKKDTGLCIYNSSLINLNKQEYPFTTIGVDASKIALSLGNIKVFNMIMLGALTSIINIISDKSITESITQNLPSLPRKLLTLNLSAYYKGRKKV